MRKFMFCLFLLRISLFATRIVSDTFPQCYLGTWIYVGSEHHGIYSPVGSADKRVTITSDSLKIFSNSDFLTPNYEFDSCFIDSFEGKSNKLYAYGGTEFPYQSDPFSLISDTLRQNVMTSGAGTRLLYVRDNATQISQINRKSHSTSPVTSNTTNNKYYNFNGQLIKVHKFSTKSSNFRRHRIDMMPHKR